MIVSPGASLDREVERDEKFREELRKRLTDIDVLFVKKNGERGALVLRVGTREMP